MKRRDLIKHLILNDCKLMREGSNHSIYVNQLNQKVSTLPRHREINDFLAKKICRNLQIPLP
ncbi:MAG: type II toxin-antitoxin system HicA family toxin [bacterium]